MEISGISGIFDGYEWIQGPLTVDIQSSKITAIHKSVNPNADYYLPDHIIAPPFVDGHTHLIFAGDRSFELPLKIAGTSYAEILEKGGGIINTVQSTREASDDELLESVLHRLDAMLEHGSLVVEAKSGYGLTADQELRLLRVLAQANTQHPIEIISTYCGAHALTGETSRESYVDEVISILPEIAKKGLATSTDVFCDRGAFTVDETVEILRASKEVGIPTKVHAEELMYTGIGKIAAAKFQALSVDHLLYSTEDDFTAYANAGTTAMFMPAATIGLFTTQRPTGWNKANSKLNIGLGSDFNPNNLVVSMQTAMRLAVFLYKMSPHDAIKAATSGSFQGITGEKMTKLEEGSSADFLILKGNSINQIMTNFDVNLVRHIFKKGKLIFSKS